MIGIIRRGVSLVLLLAGIGLLSWASMPGRRLVVNEYIEPTSMQVRSNGQADIPTLLEIRQVQLEWPAIVRIGDQSEITLVFAPAAPEILAPTPQGDFANVYDSYNLMVEGRFEVAGLGVNPSNPRRESLPSGQTVRFGWTIRAREAQIYPGEVWLSLRFLPLDGSPASQVPIFVQKVDIQATSLIGLSGPQGRGLGGLCIIVGLAMSYDVVIGLARKVIKILTVKDRTKTVQMTTKDT